MFQLGTFPCEADIRREEKGCLVRVEKGACTHGPLCSLLCFSDEENFCATVPKDGRSYSPTLFVQTVRVLKKINKSGNMIVAFRNLAEQIKVR